MLRSAVRAGTAERSCMLGAGCSVGWFIVAGRLQCCSTFAASDLRFCKPLSSCLGPRRFRTFALSKTALSCRHGFPLAAFHAPSRGRCRSQCAPSRIARSFRLGSTP
eukprot:6207345-Pleurochrysis_carterae.AAC.2